MADVFAPKKRSLIMSRIRSQDTSPELRVKKAVRGLGLRYRAHMSTLPGKPDIALPRKKIALFVHGCFWHQHRGCSRQFLPKSNRRYWLPKLKRNVERFNEVKALLRKVGWRGIVLWECQTKDSEKLRKRIENLLHDMDARGRRDGI